MGSCGNQQGEGVKIVQIDTRYVQTDALNFRDVVQSLTGKNSSTAWVGSGGSDKVVPLPRASVKSDESQFRDRSHKEDTSSLSSMILKNSATTTTVASFRDFDRLLYELPPAEDLPWPVGR